MENQNISQILAIMVTDIVKFTKIMGYDESTGISIIQNQQTLFNPIIDSHEGIIIKTIEFPNMHLQAL